METKYKDYLDVVRNSRTANEISVVEFLAHEFKLLHSEAQKIWEEYKDLT